MQVRLSVCVSRNHVYSKWIKHGMSQVGLLLDFFFLFEPLCLIWFSISRVSLSWSSTSLSSKYLPSVQFPWIQGVLHVVFWSHGPLSSRSGLQLRYANLPLQRRDFSDCFGAWVDVLGSISMDARRFSYILSMKYSRSEKKVQKQSYCSCFIIFWEWSYTTNIYKTVNFVSMRDKLKEY